LQKHGFQWEDEDFDILYKKYPNCKIALMWWCNQAQCDSFNIKNNKWLKEFMVENPPDFNISNKCCDYAKKKVMSQLIKKNEYDLHIVGVRKSEGGARAKAYHNCFDDNDNECDNYRPLFWYTNSDKQVYESHFGIVHSECYTQYGLKRTGCAGCPYGREFENELQTINKHEPRLFAAVNNIFGKAYEYTRKYKEFYKQMNNCK
jgi:3'-phosphoadenosine 5'-phosphosulfate sulfotransferase (PAPS reductase)/FAD synthetase